MERTTCCVVGGGPAGMVLGLLLARAGVEVTVLEKHADFLRDFRGDTVHPTTLDLLDELGLGERFDALPQSRMEEVAFPVGDGDRLVVGDFRRLAGRVAHPYVAMVPQWDLLDLLADAAAAEPTFTLRRSTEVTDLRRDATGRVTGVAYRTADGATGELAADLTVACDGRSSTARARAGLEVVEYPCPMDAWWFRLPRHDGEDRPALTPRIGPGRMAVVIPREGYLQIASMTAKGRDAEIRARGIEAFRADVADLAPDLADRVDAPREHGRCQAPRRPPGPVAALARRRAALPRRRRPRHVADRRRGHQPRGAGRRGRRDPARRAAPAGPRHRR